MYSQRKILILLAWIPMKGEEPKGFTAQHG